ncbi:MAG: hypothetical protein ABSG25_01525 [Bryobacteraceae bacterium]
MEQVKIDFCLYYEPTGTSRCWYACNNTEKFVPEGFGLTINEILELAKGVIK